MTLPENYRNTVKSQVMSCLPQGITDVEQDIKYCIDSAQANLQAVS